MTGLMHSVNGQPQRVATKPMESEYHCQVMECIMFPTAFMHHSFAESVNWKCRYTVK